MRRSVLIFACLIVASVTMAQSDPVAALQAKLANIQAQADLTLAKNATMKPRNRLPDWATDALTAISLTADAALLDLEQLIILMGPAKPPGSVAAAAGNGGTGGAPAGNVYYVRTDGSNTNCDGKTNASDASTATTNCAWGTPDHASDNVAAGDWIRVQPGHYGQTISPSDSGTSGNPVTIIADGAVTACAFSFTGQSYVRMIGFELDGTGSGCNSAGRRVLITGTNTGLEFWNNTLTNSDNNMFLVDSADRCNECIIIGGSLSAVGIPGCFNALTITGDDTFVGYLEFDDICYLGVVPSGHRMRIVNMYQHDLVQSGTSHPDFLYVQGLSTLGYSNNLIESWFGIGTTTANDNKVMHLQTQTSPTVVDWEDNIWRQNVFYNMGSGYYSLQSTSGNGEMLRNRFYNDTVVKMVQAQNQSDPQFRTAGRFEAISGSQTASVYNTIFVEGWTEAARTGGSVSGWTAPGAGTTVTSNFNLLYDSRGSVTNGLPDANPQVNVNPQFVSLGTDFSLQSGSGARGVGGALTATSGSGTGTTFSVVAGTGSFFIGDNSANLDQYGGALVPGDFITVGTDVVQVVSVSGDDITVSSSFTWADADPVYFGSSTTIDLGAFPYKAGGYTLSATYSVSGSTVTIAPNDASLVRFVICYSDGMPYTIDNSSPYTCERAYGDFSARVYPRFASTTLYAEATP